MPEHSCAIRWRNLEAVDVIPLIVQHGCQGLRQLRDELLAARGRPGNDHWGTRTDVQSLSDALDLRILQFRGRLPPRSDACL